MNREVILRESPVTRPFEARLISNELRSKVIYFQKLLTEKRLNSKLVSKKFKIKSIDEQFKQNK